MALTQEQIKQKIALSRKIQNAIANKTDQQLNELHMAVVRSNKRNRKCH